MAARGPLVPPPVGDPLQGRYLLVKYDVPEQVWHARLALAHVHLAEWIILTPDGDIYSEVYSQDNMDLSSWRAYDPDTGMPFGIDPSHVHDFNPRPNAAAVTNLIAEGQVHASAERLRRGIPAPVPVAPQSQAVGAVPPLAGPSPAPIAAGAGGGAVAAAANPPPLLADGGDPLANLGGGGLLGLGGGDPDHGDDARTLSITRDGDGIRFKDYRVAVQESKAVDFADWPIHGPRTVKHVITQILNHGGSPIAHHQAWRVACKLQPSDGPSMEHEAWSRVLETMMVYDQLDTTNLASAELVVRALQRIEEKHKHKIAASEDAGESSLFMGASGGSRTGLIISPKLTEWIGSEMQKEALVAKERRKAREERALARKGEKKEEAGK